MECYSFLFTALSVGQHDGGAYAAWHAHALVEHHARAGHIERLDPPRKSRRRIVPRSLNNNHYEFYIVPSSIVFDLRDISAQTSMLDVSRVLLQFAASRKDAEYERVTLSFRGAPKFVIKGDYFRTLGAEYGPQNPIYTLRTMPEHMYRMDGTQAFGTWTGGLIGVLAKQMEDFNELHKQWYVSDLAGARP